MWYSLSLKLLMFCLALFCFILFIICHFFDCSFLMFFYIMWFVVLLYFCRHVIDMLLLPGRVTQHTSLSLHLLLLPFNCFSSRHSLLFLPLPLLFCNRFPHHLRLSSHSNTINSSFLFCGKTLFVSVRDAASGKIVSWELAFYAITNNDTNRVLPYLPWYSGEY